MSDDSGLNGELRLNSKLCPLTFSKGRSPSMVGQFSQLLLLEHTPLKVITQAANAERIGSSNSCSAFNPRTVPYGTFVTVTPPTFDNSSSAASISAALQSKASS